MTLNDFQPPLQVPSELLEGSYLAHQSAPLLFEHLVPGPGRTMRCMLHELTREDGATVFVLSELASNEGPSILNCCESLVPAVFDMASLRRPHLTVDNVRFIEHFGDFSYANGRGGEETFDWLVTRAEAGRIHVVGHAFCARRRSAMKDL